MKKDNWILKAFLMTFFIALFFSSISNIIINKFNYIALFIFSLLFIFIGILFDVIGTAVLIADEKVFHAKSSQKIKGAKESVYLIKNASRIASICNDIIGDICGIISGSVGAMLALYLSNITDVNSIYTTLFVSSIISSLTVGGKAIGKKIASNKNEIIVTKVGTFLSIFKRGN